jgi:hypothetical protein
MPDGQEPPQVPHWMHISKRVSPGVAAMTCSKKFFLGMAAASGNASMDKAVSAVNVHLLMDAIFLKKAKRLPQRPGGLIEEAA